MGKESILVGMVRIRDNRTITSVTNNWGFFMSRCWHPYQVSERSLSSALGIFILGGKNEGHHATTERIYGA